MLSSITWVERRQIKTRCVLRSVQPHLDAVHDVCVVVALLVSIGSRQREQVVIPGMGGFGVALISLGLQLQSKSSQCGFRMLQCHNREDWLGFCFQCLAPSHWLFEDWTWTERGSTWTWTKFKRHQQTVLLSSCLYASSPWYFPWLVIQFKCHSPV